MCKLRILYEKPDDYDYGIHTDEHENEDDIYDYSRLTETVTVSDKYVNVIAYLKDHYKAG